MKAIVQHAYGQPDVLALENIPVPVIGDNDVLIRVRASSINHADVVYLTGVPKIARVAFGMTRPKQSTRGKDVAGVIESVGTNVTAVRPGDEVYAEVEAGGFAEYVSAPESSVSLKPRNLSFEQAAAVPLSATAALQGLRAGRVAPGAKVLINGASGGVGTFAVQIAKALGAQVTGVCSARNLDLVRSLGADHVIDYATTDFTLGSERYDLILDSISNHSLADLRGVLASKGTLVLSSGNGGRILGPMGRILGALLVSPFVSQSLVTFTGKSGTHVLDDLRALIEAGQVTPAIDRAYPLSEVPEALRYFMHEHASAKISITF
jgi:NADPH:quinone reductase-like Zn-dependent oxidoreductase